MEFWDTRSKFVSNLMSANCLVRLAKDCYIDYKRNPTALRLIRKINQLHLESNEGNNGTGVTMENFAAFTRSHPSLLAPVLAIQKLVHTKTFGVRTWNRFQRERNQINKEELYQLFSEFNPFFFINFTLREPIEKNVKVPRDPNILFKQMSYRDTVAMNTSNNSNPQQQIQQQQQSTRRRSSGGSEGITLRPLRMTSTSVTRAVDVTAMVPPYGPTEGTGWGESSRGSAFSKLSQESTTVVSNNYYLPKPLSRSVSINTDIATARPKHSSRPPHNPTRSSMTMFSTTGGRRRGEGGDEERRTSLPLNRDLPATGGSQQRKLGTSNTNIRSYDNSNNSSNNYNYYNINNKSNNVNGIYRKQLSSSSLRGPAPVSTDRRLEPSAATTREASKMSPSQGGYGNAAVITTESRVRFNDGKHSRTSSSSSVSFQRPVHQHPTGALKRDVDATHPTELANLTGNVTVQQYRSDRRSTTLRNPSSKIYESTVHHSSRSLMGPDYMTTRSSKDNTKVVEVGGMITGREESQRLSLRQRLEIQRSNLRETADRNEINTVISRNRAPPSTDLYNGKIEDFYFTSPYHNFVSMQATVTNQPPPPRQLTAKASKSSRSSSRPNNRSGHPSASLTPTSSNNNGLSASRHSSPPSTPSRRSSLDTGSAASRSPSSFLTSPPAYFRPISFRTPTTPPPPSISMNQFGVTNYRNNNSNRQYISHPTEVVGGGSASKSAPLSATTSPMKQLKKVPLEAQRAYSARMISSQKSSSSSSLFSGSNYSPRGGGKASLADETERVDTAPHLL